MVYTIETYISNKISLPYLTPQKFNFLKKKTRFTLYLLIYSIYRQMLTRKYSYDEVYAKKQREKVLSRTPFKASIQSQFRLPSLTSYLSTFHSHTKVNRTPNWSRHLSTSRDNQCNQEAICLHSVIPFSLNVRCAPHTQTRTQILLLTAPILKSRCIITTRTVEW